MNHEDDFNRFVGQDPGFVDLIVWDLSVEGNVISMERNVGGLRAKSDDDIY